MKRQEKFSLSLSLSLSNLQFTLFFSCNYYKKGGPVPFICGGEKSYFRGLDQYGHSTRTVVQFSVWIFFSQLSFCHWFLFSFNLFSNSVRFGVLFFEKMSFLFEKKLSCFFFFVFLSLCFFFSSLFKKKKKKKKKRLTKKIKKQNIHTHLRKVHSPTSQSEDCDLNGRNLFRNSSGKFSHLFLFWRRTSPIRICLLSKSNLCFSCANFQFSLQFLFLFSYFL